MAEQRRHWSSKPIDTGANPVGSANLNMPDGVNSSTAVCYTACLGANPSLAATFAEGRQELARGH